MVTTSRSTRRRRSENPLHTTSNSNFILTVNEASLEFYEDIRRYLTGLTQFQYYLCTEHVGNENKHYHIFVQYNQSKYLSYSRLHGAHVEECYGSAQQNIDYLWARDEKHKDENVTAVLIDEEGEVKLKGGNWSVGVLKNMDNPDELPAVLYNTYTKIRAERSKRLTLGSWRKNVQVYYIQGPSAIGKSEKAEELIKKYYQDKGIEEENEMYFDEVKYINGFYTGVNLEYPTEVAIFDDFRAGNMKPEEFINLIDYRIHNMNVKGTEAKNNYKLIIFTSVQRLASIYKNVEDYERREQWERRIKVINMYPPERVHVGGYPVGYRTEFNELENYNPLEEVEVTDNWDGTTTVLN